MLKVVQHIGLLALLVSSSFPANANTNRDALLNTLMEKSGINATLTHFPQNLKSIAARQKPSKCTPPHSQHFAMAVDGAFDAKTLTHNMRSKLHDTMSVGDMQQILAWLNTPLGAKITALENEASSPQALLATQEQFAALSLDSARVAQLEQLIDATNMVAYSTSLAEKMQVSVVKAIMHNSLQQTSLQELQLNIEKNHSSLRGIIQRELQMSGLYTYQSLSNTELQQYIDFIKSPIGQKYHTTTTIALNYITTKAGERFGQLLMMPVPS